MDQNIRFIWYATILSGCILLCNQFIHLNNLYQLEKNSYIHHQNEFIQGAVYEFNMKHTSFKQGGYRISFNAKTNKLIYAIDSQRFCYQLYPKDNIKHIIEQCTYDMRDTEFWTLEHFYIYLEEKRDSASLANLSIQLFILNDTGKIEDSYPEKQVELPTTYAYKDTLGFVFKDILFATYDYPITLFLRTVAGEIILICFITILLTLCVIIFYQTICKEKKSSKYRELFIDHMVHDLKRPVANQLKICYLLRESITEKQLPLFKQSEKQLNEMLYSIHRMLLQSTDEHGLRLNLQSFDLGEVLQTLTVKEQWNVKEDKQFDIRIHFLSTDNAITGDYHFLNAVFQNLVDNALKYSGDRVNVNITCEDAGSRFIRVVIRDNGFGISPQNLKHVFERYNRGDHQNDKEVKGHGQGLYYSRVVILAHGGKIDIKSTEGEETSVIIVLPRKAKIKKKYLC